jgi:hypothetical protein
MFRRVVVQIEFPELEYQKVASKFADALSIRYRVKKSLFYLGTVQSVYKQTPEMIVTRIEIRKDETPAWYARSIIERAQKEEIFVLQNSETMSRRGKITKVEGLDKCSNNDIVEPLEVWIIPSERK